MVTHDSMIASYSQKLLYIKDGQIAETIERKDLTQKEYFYKIVDVNSTESQKLFIDQLGPLIALYNEIINIG